MDVKRALDEKVAKWLLLEHPFYRAWEAGELPVESLKVYAEEYGAFITRLPDGWRTLDDAETIEEEIEHTALWGDFAAGLGTKMRKAQIAETKLLEKTAEESFGDPVKALGALYAFEVQQPATAQSKLDGLRKHYELPLSVEPYFEEHSHNEHESEKLLSRIGSLSKDEQALAVQACEEMSKALWDALSGIHAAQMAH